MAKIYELRDLDKIYEVTGLSEHILKRIEEYGYLRKSIKPGSILYHLEPKLKKDRKLKISFLKGLYSYGFDQDLWEAAVFRKKKVRGVAGYLTEDDLLTYIVGMMEILSNDPTYFDTLPLEIKNHE